MKPFDTHARGHDWHAGPSCPRVLKESFLSGTEPTEVCDVHK